MDLLTSLVTLGSNILFYLVPFLFILTIVVFVHEYGHYKVGRWCGVDVTTFSIGFGKELFGWTDKHGTRWRFAAIPLGGYVKFAGDSNAASQPDADAVAKLSQEELSRTLPGATVGRRSAIVAAGPVANFIFAILVFAAIVMAFGRTTIAPRIDRVTPASAAAQAGLAPGDLIVSVDGVQMSSFDEVRRIITINAENTLRFVVLRNSVETAIDVTPALVERRHSLGVERVGVIGVTAANRPEDVRQVSYGPIEAISYGVRESWFIVTRTFDYLGKLLTGREKADQLSGVIHIAEVSGHVASTGGIVSLLTLAAVLSVSIGLMNLFPIPMLDGGHLVFYAFEALRGRPLSERVQEYAFKAGIAFVLMLTVFVTWNDITRIVTRAAVG
ncbi:MAG: RIP metalloprotease RseP [Beijerinckiaceae bacterium]|jgi:regulator of sigma E protease|nr:RIP metalloprotease RseP [Beijerinckiaceae bacterium]